jgi:MFS family permease
MGFVSSTTIIPLFIDTLTDSTAIIGLLASVHTVGWQLPQILTVNRVARLRRYKPMVLVMTTHERWPFLAMVAVVLLLPTIGPAAVLWLAFILLGWRALGGGLTGTAWQSMIGKVIPLERRGAFWGAQSAAANLLSAASAPLAGVILVKVAYPHNFALCFFLASFWMVISWVFLAMTREPEREIPVQQKERPLGWSYFKTILRADGNFRLFILARFLTQFGVMATAFYTIYGVRHLGLDEVAAGGLYSVLTLSATVANPILGWLGDRWGHRLVFAGALLAVAGGALLAIAAPNANWLYPVFALAGIGHVGSWTIAMTMTVEFGTEDDRPYYIGLTNTLIAPATLVAPFIGGWLADAVGFGATFTLAAVASIITVAILTLVIHDPQPRKRRERVAQLA